MHKLKGNRFGFVENEVLRENLNTMFYDIVDIITIDIAQKIGEKLYERDDRRCIFYS